MNNEHIDQSQSGGLPHLNAGGIEESKNEFTFGGDGGLSDYDIDDLELAIYDLLSPAK